MTKKNTRDRLCVFWTDRQRGLSVAMSDRLTPLFHDELRWSLQKPFELVFNIEQRVVGPIKEQYLA